MLIIQFIAVSLLILFMSPGQANDSWQTLAPGMDLGTFSVTHPDQAGNANISVLRIDPERWSLEFVGLSLTGGKSGQTARQWSKTHGLTAAINAGMFATDHKTHVGYLRFQKHVNNDNVNSYRSVAAFDPQREGMPSFRLFDLDNPGVSLQTILRDYASVVQNLRLIKRPAKNRWRHQEKRWSEAALGEDTSGRMLFIFCPTPYTMHDFNNVLLSLGIGLVAAQHLEGGSQAQLYVNAGGVEVELSGSQGSPLHVEHGFSSVWPIPNVLGVRPRDSVTK